MYCNKKPETAAAKFSMGSARNRFVASGKLSQLGFPHLPNLTEVKDN